MLAKVEDLFVYLLVLSQFPKPLIMKKFYDIEDKIEFGKHKGVLLRTIVDDHSSYLRWAMREIAGFDISSRARLYLANNFNRVVDRIDHLRLAIFLKNGEKDGSPKTPDSTRVYTRQDRIRFELTYIRDFLKLGSLDNIDKNILSWNQPEVVVVSKENLNINTTYFNVRYLQARSCDESSELFFSVGFPLSLMKQIVSQKVGSDLNTCQVYVFVSNVAADFCHRCYIGLNTYDADEISILGTITTTDLEGLQGEHIHEGHVLLLLHSETINNADIHFGHYDNIERPTYIEYNGSYAQDIEGYSDQDINDAFDGHADAYWNID